MPSPSRLVVRMVEGRCSRHTSGKPLGYRPLHVISIVAGFSLNRAADSALENEMLFCLTTEPEQAKICANQTYGLRHLVLFGKHVAGLDRNCFSKFSAGHGGDGALHSLGSELLFKKLERQG